MKKVLAIAVCMGILCLAGSAGAVTLTFEDLNGGTYSGSLPTNYHGLTWGYTWTYWNSSPPYNASSGVKVIFPGSGGRDWIDFGTQVTFQGSWVASANAGQDIYWEGYQGGVKIFESPHLSGGAQAYINVNWPGVDYVNFVDTTGAAYSVIDDIKYDPVPLPGAFWLLGSGLLGLVGWRRLRKS